MHTITRALALALPLLFLGACTSGESSPTPAPEPAPVADTPDTEPDPEPEPSTDFGPGLLVRQELDARITEHRNHERVTAALSEAARAVVEAPDSVRLYSVDPGVHADYGYGGGNDPSPLQNALAALSAGRGVLGSLDLGNGADVGAITGRVYAGLVEMGDAAHCYIPRHALVYAKGDEKVIVYICFACSYAVTLEKTIEKGRYRGFQDVGGLKADLNARLAEAGIKLAD